jgi:hypothetical protein
MLEPVSVILVGNNGWTKMEASLLAERITSAYGFHKPWWKGVGFFHRDGSRYEVSSARPSQVLPLFSRLLAATIYNPQLTVRYEYQSGGRYELADLKEALVRAIDKVDDILTQYHNAEDLKRRVTDARTFDDAVEVLVYAATDTYEPGASDED